MILAQFYLFSNSSMALFSSSVSFAFKYDEMERQMKNANKKLKTKFISNKYRGKKIKKNVMTPMPSAYSSLFFIKKLFMILFSQSPRPPH